MSLVETFESSMSNILDFMQNAPIRLEELLEELSAVDLEISDLNHYLEFLAKEGSTGFNACEGYYIARDLQELFVKRRKIKNEHSLLESTYTRFSCSIGGIKKVEQLKKGVDKSIHDQSRKRTYTPRKRPELFERFKEQEMAVTDREEAL